MGLKDSFQKIASSFTSKFSNEHSNDYKVILFIQESKNLGVIPKVDHINDLDLDLLLTQAYTFLTQETVLAKKDKLQREIYKEHYNRFLEYCSSYKLIKQTHQKVDNLAILEVPDMSKIEVPDISKELKEMNINLDEIGETLGSILGNKGK